jgi:hypothetical protein
LILQIVNVMAAGVSQNVSLLEIENIVSKSKPYRLEELLTCLIARHRVLALALKPRVHGVTANSENCWVYSGLKNNQQNDKKLNKTNRKSTIRSTYHKLSGESGL